MKRIRYEQGKRGTVVILDGKRVGAIKRVGHGAYCYFPTGHPGGTVFTTERAVKESLEADA